MRHATTATALTRRDFIIVASVSCIYGIGDPEEYEKGKSTEKDLWWGETNLQKEVKKLVNKVKRKIK